MSRGGREWSDSIASSRQVRFSADVALLIRTVAQQSFGWPGCEMNYAVELLYRLSAL